MHILHTVLYTFPKVLTRRICLKINVSLVGGQKVNANIICQSSLPNISRTMHTKNVGPIIVTEQ